LNLVVPVKGFSGQLEGGYSQLPHSLIWGAIKLKRLS